MDFFNLLGLAVAPGIAIMLYVYWSDTHEKEPTRLVLLSFFYGCLSVLVTLTISAILYSFIVLEEDNILHQGIDAFFMVALVEEFSKFIFVRWLIFPKKDFNEPYDGIVYTVMVGMGFATVENIMYVFQGGYSVGILRMFTAVPAHAAFAVLMGYFLGMAKFRHDVNRYAMFGLISAMLLHGAYDFFLFISWIPGIWLGALISLILGIVLSFKAMKIHREDSPFK